MIFNDYVDYYNEINNILNNLDEYIETIKDIKNTFINWTMNTTTKMYSGSINSSNFNSYNKSARDIVSNIKTKIIKLDPFVYGHVVNLKNLYQEYIEYDIELKTLIESFETCISYLHEFSNADYASNEIKSALEKLLCILSDLIRNFDDIRRKNELLNTISSNIKYKKYDDNAQILTLRFYNTDNSLENYSFILRKIEDSYDRICSTANISTQQSAIIPIKIESGSLFAKMAGNPFAMEVLKILFTKVFEYIVNKTLSNLDRINVNDSTSKPEDFENIRQAIDILSVMKKHGMNTDKSQEYIEEAMTIACKNIYEITLQNSKIKVDNEILEFSKEIQSALLENEVKYLKSSEDNKTDDTDKEQ